MVSPLVGSRAMNRVAMLIMCLAAACACKSRDATGPGKGTGTGSGTGLGTGDPAQCEPLRAHLDELYRADAVASAGSGTGSNQALVDEIVADNVTMALSDCVAAPDRVARCAEKAKTSTELEERCLIPLDEEGTEGDRFKGDKK